MSNFAIHKPSDASLDIGAGNDEK